MTVVSSLLALLVAILVDTAWVALFRAKPVGKFKVVRRGESLFQFESTTGTFSVFPKERRLEVKDGNGKRVVKFSELKGMEYRVNESYALVQELFFGYDLTDTLARYQDTVDWFSVAVVTEDDKRIPLFLSGQYTQREFLLSWYIEAQSWLLDKLGLLTDVEAQSREAMDLLRTKLGNLRLL
jgi:hypothetical protein